MNNKMRRTFRGFPPTSGGGEAGGEGGGGEGSEGPRTMRRGMYTRRVRIRGSAPRGEKTPVTRLGRFRGQVALILPRASARARIQMSREDLFSDPHAARAVIQFRDFNSRSSD